MSKFNKVLWYVCIILAIIGMISFVVMSINGLTLHALSMMMVAWFSITQANFVLLEQKIDNTNDDIRRSK